MGEFRHLGDRLVHRGHIWYVVVSTFEAPTGERFERDVVRSPGAVGVVPVVDGDDGEHDVVLVSQYRPPYDRAVIEIPAGMRDVDGEPPLETARRELAEEVGLVAERMDPLTEIYPSPGLTDSVTSIFMAVGCQPVDRAPHGPEEEHAEVLRLSLREAVEWVVRGRINDAKTVTGLLLADRRLREGVR